LVTLNLVRYCPHPILGLDTYVSNSLNPCSSDLLQLTQDTYTLHACWFKNSKLSARIQFLHSKEVSHPPPSASFITTG
jgi:hypothetical protein